MTVPALGAGQSHHYRLRIRLPSTPAAPQGPGDLVVISTIPTDAHPWIADGPPSGSGGTIDPSTGDHSIASYSIRVLDNGAIPSSTGGFSLLPFITSLLMDPQGRQQLLNRNAYIEESFDTGVTWLSLIGGYINRIRLLSALVFEFSVGDTTRTDSTMQVFQNAAPGLDRMSCLLGGPIINGFGPIQDYGPCRVKVTALGTSYQMVECQFQRAWFPVDDKTLAWKLYENIIPQYGKNRANAPIDTHVTSPSVILQYLRGAVDAHLLQPFDPANALTALVTNVTRGTSAIAVIPNRENVFPNDPRQIELGWLGAASKITTATVGGNPGTVQNEFVYLDWYDPLTLAPLDATTIPSVGDILDLYVYQTTISEENPLHIDMHPIDLGVQLMINMGQSVDLVSAATMKAVLGPNLRLKLRVTSSISMQDALTSYVCLPFGIGIVNNGNGQRAFVSSRILTNVLPLVTWTELDMVGDSEPLLFDLNEEKLYNAVSIAGKRLIPFAPQANVQRPIDDMQEIDQTREIDDPSVATLGKRLLSLSIPGVISTDGSTDTDLQDFVLTFAHQLFDRYARGPSDGTVRIMRSSPQIPLGSEVILSTPRMIGFSGTIAVRGMPRCLQAIGVTIREHEVEYQLEDSGSTSQTSVAPVFTLTADTLDPNHYGDVAITNVATLTGDYAVQPPSTSNALNVAVIPNGAGPGDEVAILLHNQTVTFTMPSQANGSNQQIVTATVDVDMHDLDPAQSATLTMTDTHGQTATLTVTGGTILTASQLQTAAAYVAGDVIQLKMTYSIGSTPPAHHNGTMTVHSAQDQPPGLNLAVPQSGGPGIQLQYATGPAAPPNGVLFFGRLIQNTGKSGPFPSVIRTPSAPMGTTIWVSARTTVTGQRPSPWTAWQSLTLGSFTGTSGLSATNLGGGQVALTWTNPDATTPVWVSLRVHGLTAYHLEARLGPGANQYTFTKLIPGTQYDAEVAHVGPPPYLDTTTASTVTFTVSAGASTCVTPCDPVGFVEEETAIGIIGHLIGYKGPFGNYGFGFGVIGLDQTPGTIVNIFEALETSPGSGTYGAAALVASVTQVYGRFALYLNTTRPNDGLRRQYQACASRNGAIDSALTPAVVVNPVVAESPMDYPVAIPADFAVSLDGIVNAGAESYYLRLSYTPPSDFQFDHMEFSIRHCPIGGTITGAPLVIIGGTSGSDMYPVVAGQQYEVTPITVTKGGYKIFTDGTMTTQARNFGSPVTLTVAIGSAQPNFATPAADGTNVYYSWVQDLYTSYIEVFSKTYTSDPGAVASVEAPANYIPPTLDYSKTSLALPVDATNQWRVTTFVPYNQRAVRGVPQTFKTQRNAGATTVVAPSLSLGGSTPTSVTVDVTWTTTPAVGDQFVIYRGGVQVMTHTINAGDIGIGALSMVDFSTIGGNTYSYTATQTTGGITSALSSTLTVTPSAGTTLTAPPTPTMTLEFISFRPPIPSCLGVGIQFNVSSLGNPAGTVYDVYTSNDNITFVLLLTNAGITPDSNLNVNASANRDVAAHTVYAKALARLAGYTTSAFSAVANAGPAGSTCR